MTGPNIAVEVAAMRALADQKRDRDEYWAAHPSPCGGPDCDCGHRPPSLGDECQRYVLNRLGDHRVY